MVHSLGIPFSPKDFYFTEEELALALNPPPFTPNTYGTWNSLTLFCSLCRVEIGEKPHVCEAIVACGFCDSFHEMGLRECEARK